MPEQRREENVEAFGLLVQKHQRAVFCLAYGKLRNVQDAEDVTQEVFAEAYRKMTRLAHHDYALGWFMKATIFRCKDHLRKTLRRRKRELNYMDFQKSSTDARHAEDRSDGLIDAIATLPEKYRTLLMLKHFAKLSYADISRITGLPKSTIDGRLRLAKKELKAMLEERQRS